MLSLVADYSATSSSSDDDDLDDGDKEVSHNKRSNTTSSPPAAPPNKPLLPSANILLSSNNKSMGVVFNNPFLEAEKAEIDKLQKHVKMVESEEHLVQKNGRKICWNNRKGRCRFGNKCKYAHDSDLVAAANEEVNEIKEELKHSTPSANAFVVKSAHLGHSSADTAITDTTEVKIAKSRKRPGLGDSIMPGKKVMKQYQQQTSKTKTS